MKYHRLDKLYNIYSLVYNNKGNRLENYKKYLKRRYKLTDKEIRELISLWFPEVNKIELFARKRIKGWDCWGDEVKSDTALVSNSSPDKSGSFNRNLKDLSADKSQISANAETSLNSDIPRLRPNSKICSKRGETQ